MRGLKSQLGFLLLLTTGIVVAQNARVSTSAAVKDYSISFFSDAGYHKMRVEGGSADLKDRNKIQLENMTLTLFSGQADRSVESVLMAPVAVLQPDTEMVSGSDAVRLIRDDLELFGEDWSYDHRARKIHLRRNAKIIFNANLAEYLK
jgi:hypothetical protein